MNGGSLRGIAGQFGVARSSVERHKADHLPATLTQSAQAAEVFQADSLVDQVRCLQSKTLSILEKASIANDHRVALQAIGVARNNIELLARLVGEIQEQSQTVNILVASTPWQTLRAAILQALDPYPEARRALMGALGQTEQMVQSVADPPHNANGNIGNGTYG